MQCHLPYDGNMTIGQMIQLQANMNNDNQANEMTENETTDLV